jgi:hypothetical protein
MTTVIEINSSPEADLQQVLPRVWRWADAAGESDRCGTALLTSDGVVLVDPPALSAADRERLEAEAGPIRHVLLTSARHAPLAAPLEAAEVTIWAPATEPDTVIEGIDRLFNFRDALPGGVLALQLPETAAPGEVAYLWPDAGEGLLITGDVLPLVGQTPVYLEGNAPPVPAYQDALKALLAAEPGTLAPAHHAPPEEPVIRATAWAAHIGNTLHRRRAAPVQGPRFLVPQAQRVLEEVLAAPVVLRWWSGDRPNAKPDAAPEEVGWVADPFACSRCGRPHEPMLQTCGGPMIARLCPACRVERRQELPAARLMVCAGGCCTRLGARAVLSAARQAARASGVAGTLDVVPVTCLGECSIGPFITLSTARGQELPEAAEYRARTIERAQRYADEEGEVIDEETEKVLSRFAALVEPAEAARLVERVAGTLKKSQTEPGAAL